LRILAYPDPHLREAARAVERIDARLRRVIGEMFPTMYEARGVGLAATQVGVPLRLFVVNVTGEPEGEMVIINPELSVQEGERIAEEGCLSVPGVTASIRRPARVIVCGYDVHGEEVEYECEDFFARAICHELDHLDGQLILDRMGQTAKLTQRSRLKELEEAYHDSDSPGSCVED